MTSNANALNNVKFFSFMPQLQNLTWKSIYLSNAGSGNIDFSYTVPAGKRAMFAKLLMFNNTGTTQSLTPAKTADSITYKQLSTPTTILTALETAIGVGYVLEAGEKPAVITTASGFNAWLQIAEFDSVTPFFSSSVTITSGNNTIYTCPAGKQAYTPAVGASFINGIGGISYTNFSGSGTTIKSYDVESGGTPGNTNITTAAAGTSVSDQTLTAFVNLPGLMLSGESLVLNSSSATAGQFAWVNVFEMLNPL